MQPCAIAIMIPIVLLACSALPQRTKAGLFDLKPHETLSSEHNSSSDILSSAGKPVPLGKDSIRWQEFSFGHTLHVLILRFDAAPLHVSAMYPVEYTYYHDGENWRSHSTTRDYPTAVSIDWEKKQFAFPGRTQTLIAFEDVYTTQMKKHVQNEKTRRKGGSNKAVDSAKKQPRFARPFLARHGRRYGQRRGTDALQS